MKDAKQIIGSIGFCLICFGICLADSESFTLTLVCMGFGIIMMLPMLKER